LNKSDDEKLDFDNQFESIKTQMNLSTDLDKAIDVVQDESFSFLNLSSKFTDHSLIADKINELPNLGWKATSYDMFKHKSL